MFPKNIKRVFPSFLNFFFFSSLFVYICLPLTAQTKAASRYNDKIINEIIVQGNERYPDEQIKGFFSLKQGIPLNLSELRKNFKEVFQSGFLKDIKIDIVEKNDGLIITLIIQENLDIGKLFFVGAEVFSSLQLLDEMKQLRFGYYDIAQINSARYTIIRKYLEKGYLDVDVDYTSESSPVNPNATDVTFLIREGPRYLVKEVRFNGNTNVASKELENSMNSKVDTFFTAGLYDPFNLQIDQGRIEYKLRDSGYYKGKVTNISVSYEWKPDSNKRDKYVIIDIGIQEGGLYYFGKIDLKGNSLFSDNEILFDFQREEGKIFRQSIHDYDLRSIYDKYQPNGYIFVRVTPIETINPDNTIDFVFDIYEGDKTHLENIYIEGLNRTKEIVVFRELTIEEGEIFDVDKIRSSLLNLNRLDFFSSVQPDYRTGSTEGLMNLFFIIKEKSTANISGGFAYSFSTGLSLNAEFKEKNFLGLGHSFSTKVTVGLLEKTFYINYTEPWLFNRPVSLGGTLNLSKVYLNYYIDDNDKLNPAGKSTVSSPDQGDRGYVNNANNSILYTQDKVEGSIFSGQKFLSWFEVYESLSVIFIKEYLQKFKIWPEKYNQFEIYKYNEKLFNTPPPINDEVFTIKLGVGISYDSRDNLLTPSSGVYSSLRADMYFLGYSLTSWSFDTGFYDSIAWRLDAFPQLLWKLTFGYKFKFRTLGRSLANNFKSSSSLSLALERNELRGWEYAYILNYRRSLGGDAYLLKSKAYGQSTFIQNFEIIQNFGFDLLQIVYFFDIGNLSVNQISFIDSKSWNFLFNWEEFMYSTGFGIRLNFAQLPIRFYFAWRFIYDPRAKTLVGYENPLYSSGGNTYKPTIVFDINAFF